MSTVFTIENLLKLLGENQKMQGIEITEDTNLINDFGFDSVDLMRTIVSIENEFDIDFSIEDLDIENVMYVKKLFYLINSKLVLKKIET